MSATPYQDPDAAKLALEIAGDTCRALFVSLRESDGEPFAIIFLAAMLKTSITGLRVAIGDDMAQLMVTRLVADALAQERPEHARSH